MNEKSATTTFVDILAVRANFCVQYADCETIIYIYFVTKFGWNISDNDKIMLFQPRQPPIFSFWALQNWLSANGFTEFKHSRFSVSVSSDFMALYKCCYYYYYYYYCKSSRLRGQRSRSRRGQKFAKLSLTRNTFCGTWYLPHSHVHN